MTDFAEMARAAREKHESKIAEQNRDAAQKQSDLEERLRNARSALALHVRPALEQASQAFDHQGISCSIEETQSFSNAQGHQIWVMLFRCCDKPNGGMSPLICGKRVRFEHDGTTLSILGEGQRLARSKFPSIQAAIQYALDTLFAEMKN